MRRFAPTVVVAAALSVLLGGGAFAAPTPAGTVAGTSAGSVADVLLVGPQQVVLTPADNGRTIRVNPGDSIALTLGDLVVGPTTWGWTPAVSSNETVVIPSQAFEAPATIGVLFRAGVPGVATLTAQGGCRVTSAGGVCPLVVVLWRVTVIVTPCRGPIRDSAGAATITANPAARICPANGVS